jgi:hypothetical protein
MFLSRAPERPKQRWGFFIPFQALTSSLSDKSIVEVQITDVR